MLVPVPVPLGPYSDFPRSSGNRQMGLSPETTISAIEPAIESPGQRVIEFVDVPDPSQSENQYCMFTLER
jgi:hypothetical protein